jgi:uncharacterized repeat protein (TIGR01451 family)
MTGNEEVRILKLSLLALLFTFFAMPVAWTQEEEDPPPAEQRFGVDGLTLGGWLSIISELGDGASGSNGHRWRTAEPAPPVGGVHSYANLQPLIDKANAVHAAGRKLQINLMPDAGWAIETGNGTFVDPFTGLPAPKWLRIKPQYVESWAALIQYILTDVPIDYLQIGSESEYQWDGAAGFAEAVRVATAAAKAVRPETQILAAGFNFGNRFMEPPLPLTPEQVWLKQFLDESNGEFDILSLHLSHLPGAFKPTVDWMLAEMAANGYTRPIWSEDMASGPFYDEPYSTPEELAFQALVEAGDPVAIAQYAAVQAEFAVKKPVTAFAAGVQRLFLSTDHDWTDPPYYIPLWRYQGLLSDAGLRKAAFYSYKQLIAVIDGFVAVEQLGPTVFKFEFSDKFPVVVAWTDGVPSTLDLSGVMPDYVRVKTVVTTLDGVGQPIYPPDQIVSSDVVPVGITPIIVLSEAELSLTMTESPDPVLPGGTLTYVATVTNLGPSTATSVTLVDTLPAGVTFVSSMPGPPTCAMAGPTLTCGLGTLAGGASVMVTIVTTVNAGGGILLNTASVSAEETDPISGTNSATAATAVGVKDGELAHGTVGVFDLAAQPGPVADEDIFRISQKPHSSYEVVVDAASGDIGAGNGPLLERIGPDGATVLQVSASVGTGPSRSLRWANTTASEVEGETIRVRSATCGTNCGPDDIYRVRAYETTQSIPRFNNAGSQFTVLFVQNPTNRTIAGQIYFWNAAGTLVADEPLSLAANQMMVLHTANLPGAGGVSGTITIAHDGDYGALSGKTVALEPATGFSFDSALLPRP